MSWGLTLPVLPSHISFVYMESGEVFGVMGLDITCASSPHWICT